jgi:hypothetical protein
MEEEESNPQHRPASLVFDQYFSSHFNTQANALCRSKNHSEAGLEEEEEDCSGLLSSQNKIREEEDQSLHQFVQGESRKLFPLIIIIIIISTHVQ